MARLNYFCLLFFMLTGRQLFAQVSVKEISALTTRTWEEICITVGTSKELKDTVTYETVFDINDNHKDGYQVGRYIVDMPAGTAQLCDKKKVKLRGLVTVHSVSAEDLRGKNGVMQGREGQYSTFDVISLSVWDEKKKEWKEVYKKW